MVNGEECWIYYESTLKISIVFRHYHAKLNHLSRLVESGNQDPMCKDPVQEVAMALMNVQDVDTWTDHVLWLIAKRPEKALDVSAPLQTGCKKYLTDIPQSGDYQSSSSHSVTREFPSSSSALSRNASSVPRTYCSQAAVSISRSPSTTLVLLARRNSAYNCRRWC